MEIKGEKLLKKARKTPRRIFIGYIVCFTILILSCVSIDNKEQTKIPEATDFTLNGAVGMEENKYVYLEVQGITDEVAIYGNTDNESDASNDRYCIAINNGYWYVVDLNYETIDLLKEIKEYTYSNNEDIVKPEPVKIYGITEKIPDELKKLLVEFYNEGIDEADKISIDNFEEYFGSVMLNVRKSPIDTNIEEMFIVIALLGILVVIISHISIKVKKYKTNKYISKNKYKEELINQLDNCIEEMYYNNKIIFTKDFFVDLKSKGFPVFKYSDMKWIHIHNVKYYGVLTVSSNIVVHLKDGKMCMRCVEIKGNSTEEFLAVFNRLCEKAPVDCLKGFTKENQIKYKQ